MNPGAQWFDIDDGESGLTEDPQLSDVSLATSVRGRQMVSSRDDIEARYTERETVDMSAAYAAAREQGEDFARSTISEFADAVRRRTTPSIDLAARIGLCAVLNPRLRDALIGVISVSAPDAADAFTAAAAHLRGNYRVQLLTLAGLANYVAGDGPPAGIAFDLARAVDATHTSLLCWISPSGPEWARQDCRAGDHRCRDRPRVGHRLRQGQRRRLDPGAK